MNALTATPSEETVKEYVGIFQNMGWQTGLKGLATLILGLLLVRLLLHFAEKALNRSQIPTTLHAMIRTLLRILLDLVVILSAANTIGIPVTSFVTLLGLAGLAISLAVQGMLSNLASGFIILSSRPFEVGHFIEENNVMGTVREIRMLHTRLETPDGKMVYVPNSVLSGTQIINYTETGKRRVDISVSASYGNTPEQVRQAATDALKGVEGVLTDPVPQLVLESYGDSAIQYILRVWVNGADFMCVKYELMEKLYGAFASRGVVMTYPHLNVHLKGMEPGQEQ